MQILSDSTPLDLMLQFVRLMAHNMGNKCEVLVCEVFKKEFLRVAYIENPSEGRAIGSVLEEVQLEDFAKGDLFSTVRSTKGHTARIAGAALKNNDRELVGAIVTILDITEIVYMQNWLQGFSGYVPQKNTVLCEDVGQMMDLIIDQASVAIGKPIAFMNRADKKEFIRHLDERGVFQIKKSSEKVAKYLNISKFTLYACLEEIRAANNGEENTGE